jgi:diadenosine tetraphosphate (Ap4A) HIT family hydrolase
MKSGFAVIGDNQFLPGYCVLLGFPKASSLNELPMPERTQYLRDMTVIGDAIIAVCKPLRVNYSILMNHDHYLHAHIEARYDWEPDEYKCKPSCFYPQEKRYTAEFEYDLIKHGEMKRRLTEYISEHMDK